MPSAAFGDWLTSAFKCSGKFVNVCFRRIVAGSVYYKSAYLQNQTIRVITAGFGLLIKALDQINLVRDKMDEFNKKSDDSDS